MTATTTLLPPDVELWIAGAALPLAHGGELSPLRVAYELTGPCDAPVIAVLGGISADRHPFSTRANDTRGWWEPFGGPGQPGRAIDTDRFRVLGFDYLGGSGLSSGPGQAGKAIAPADQAEALALLLNRLGVPVLEAFVGCSYGGMVALEFAARFPERVRNLVVIAAAHKNHPIATAWRSIQRRVVRLGLARGAGAEALAIARGLGVATYRSPTEFAERFSGEPSFRDGRAHFPVDSYLEAQGERFAERFDPAAFLCLSESIDLHRVRPELVRVPTTVIAFEGDQLVPPQQAHELAALVAGPSRFVKLFSKFGHDGFLKEVGGLNSALKMAIEEVPQ